MAGLNQPEDVFLKHYRKTTYPRPSVTVDLAILTVAERDLKVLLIQRADHPLREAWALPGGGQEA